MRRCSGIAGPGLRVTFLKLKCVTLFLDIFSLYGKAGITERLTHFDKDGTTSWSEAPAEGIF